MAPRIPTLVAAVLALAVIAPATAADRVVRIGWLRAPNDITLAKAHGSLEPALAAVGARVEWAGPFPAAAPAFEALNAGSIDITAGSSTAVVAALAADVPLRVFAYQKMSARAEGILVKADSPIRSLADLVGRSVAVNRGGTGEYLLMRGLEKNGIDPAKVKRVYLSPSDAGPSFLQDHVDAWATWDPFIPIAERSYGARLLADGGAIGSDNAVVLVVSRAFAARDRDLLKIVAGVVQSENAWAIAHRDEAGRIWAAAMNVPAELAEAIGAADAVPTRGVVDADIDQIGAIADWYVANRIVPKRPDVAEGVVKLDE
jgi:sulfonate transport system substrate-binding protein